VSESALRRRGEGRGGEWIDSKGSTESDEATHRARGFELTENAFDKRIKSEVDLEGSSSLSAERPRRTS
jgi:hypothetical protein